MEKKNMGMKVVIVILCLFVVGLTSYIVYDKVLNKNELPMDDNNKEEIPSDDNNKDDEQILELLNGKWLDCSKATNKIYCNEIMVSGEDNYFHLIAYESENRADFNVYQGEIIKTKKDGKYFNLTVKETNTVENTETNRYIKLDISKLSDKVIDIESVDNKKINSGIYYHGLSNYEEENTLNVDDETIEKLENIFDVVYGYYDSANTYCGKVDSDGYYRPELPDGEFSCGYDKSKQFNNYQELINYLKKHMSDELVKGGKAGTKSFYLEKDGNLYCENFCKGGMYNRENIKVFISNINENEIRSNVEVKLSTMYGDIDYKYYSVTYTKNSDNWIITSYEEENKKLG